LVKLRTMLVLLALTSLLRLHHVLLALTGLLLLHHVQGQNTSSELVIDMCQSDDLIVNSNNTRGVDVNPAGRWPDAVVPFIFDTTVNDNDKLCINKAIAEIESNTCIRFPERTNETDYLTTIRNTECPVNAGYWGGVAASYVGRIGGGQPLFVSRSTQKPSCWNPGEEADISLWVHEIMHALGVSHTQTRPDRDQYVTVHFDAIIEQSQRNYEMCSGSGDLCNTHNLPYDCSSTMHYRDDAFAIGDDPTMTAKDPTSCNLTTGGQSVIQTDWDLLNLMYNCETEKEETVGCLGKSTDWRCCAEEDGGCTEGHGDCDTHDECYGNLVCGINNCFTEFGLTETNEDGDEVPVDEDADCCMEAVCDAGPTSEDCCANKPGGCDVGEGDCDNDDECAGSLVCAHGVACGSNTVDFDCCIEPTRTGGPHDWGACTPAHTCSENQGDCDTDEDCEWDLFCGVNNCPSGSESDADCCTARVCDGSTTAWRCCTPTFQCGPAEGDCDSHDDCSAGFLCGIDNCVALGNTDADPGADCCYEITCNGGDGTFDCCSPDNQCEIGQGDCDDDSDCGTDLMCGYNNCKKYFDNPHAHPETDCCMPKIS